MHFLCFFLTGYILRLTFADQGCGVTLFQQNNEHVDTCYSNGQLLSSKEHLTNELPHQTICAVKRCNILRILECVNGVWKDGLQTYTHEECFVPEYKDKKVYRKKRFFWQKKKKEQIYTSHTQLRASRNCCWFVGYDDNDESRWCRYIHLLLDSSAYVRELKENLSIKLSMERRGTCLRISPCLNGGRCSNIPESYTCDCPEIWKGSRCENAVECGRPQGVTDGTVWYTGTTLNGVATYVCNEDFNMTSGDRVRTCMASGVWIVASCKSSPCHNEGSCVNKVEDFECHCSSGWDGKTCEEDVQPPILENCSANLIVNATEKTKLVVWAEPVFSDPMNSELRLSSNYESPQSVFPWGDFTITYAATKIKNGLCTECTFNISVRPTPCEPLKQPENGALLCNGWDNAYGTFCLVGCRSNFTIHPPNRYGNWLICGASGNWSSQAPDCSLNMEKEGDILAFHPSYTDFSFDECHNTTKLRQIFISEMTSHPDLSEFCQLYQACNDVNQVNVLC
ncbi:SNED1-like protein [Mya arenaria]|uniref:SNED1-like protein n=1 Tax=Mya arenaria TaxID=6604 RepID=A0ABY7GFT1_MYAAR|nr:SNED1-like protein [Mya arenaria]